MHVKELQNQTQRKPIKIIYSNLYRSPYRGILTRTNLTDFSLGKILIFFLTLKFYEVTKFLAGYFRLRILQRLLKYTHTSTILSADIKSKKSILPKCCLLTGEEKERDLSYHQDQATDSWEKSSTTLYEADFWFLTPLFNFSYVTCNPPRQAEVWPSFHVQLCISLEQTHCTPPLPSVSTQLTQVLVKQVQHIHCPEDSLEAQYHFKPLRFTGLINQFSSLTRN